MKLFLFAPELITLFEKEEMEKTNKKEERK